MFRPRALHPVGSSLPIRPAPERSSPPKLCENGRAYITDPATGQFVCLCQLEGHTSHSTIPATHPALRGMRSINGSPRPGFADIQNYHSQLSAMASLGDQTTGILPPHIAFHPYGSMFAGMDVGGGPLRKAATRETTGPLKAWLGEHKKNPYPTKAEKIMLAIITKMTLTQVSTWFANARRRLKKDNRLGGGSGGGGGGGGGDEGGEGEEESDREGDSDCVSVSVSEDSKGLSGRTEVTLSSEGEADPDSFSDISDEDSEVFRPKSCDAVPPSQLQVTDTYDATVTSHMVPTSKDSLSEWSSKNTSQSNIVVSPPPPPPPSSCSPPHATIEKEVIKPQPQQQTKPKIWSISHILDS